MTLRSRLLCLGTIWLALPALAVTGGGPELCVVKRLGPPDFSAVSRRPVPAVGCTASCVASPGGQEVHIIRLSTNLSSLRAAQTQARPRVTLTVRPPAGVARRGRPVVLFLVASSPVDWSVLGRGTFDNDTSFQIIVSRQSRVVKSNLPASSVSSQPARNRTALQQHILQKFGCMSSFTDVAVASLVELTLGTDERAPAVCDTDKLSPNPGRSAYRFRPVTLNGCYHRSLAGIGQRDVYVIELAEQERSFRSSDVTVHLAPANSTGQLTANITLLLKAAPSVTWYLESERLSGSLLVVTENTVAKDRLRPSSLSLKVQRDLLPSSFSDLMIKTAVNYSCGPPVAFVRSPAAHRISIGLPPGQIRPAAALPDDRSEPLPSKHVSGTHEKSLPEIKRDMRRPRPTGVRRTAPSAALRHSLSVSCELGRLVVAVPAAEADRWHVDALRLADPACQSFRNTTNLVISQPLDACQTRRRVVDGTAVYDNTVYFVSFGVPPDDEDFEGSGSGLGLPEPWEDEEEGMAEDVPEETSGGLVPVSCTHPGRARAPEVTPQQGRRHQLGGLADSGMDASGYSLDLFSDQLLTSPIGPNALVPITHTIYVRASARIVSAPDLRPLVERCWISKDGDADAPYKFLVVRAACPVDASVTFPSARCDGDVFTFQVSRQYLELGPYYLHCRVGLCAQPRSPTSPRVAQCLDRVRYCAASSGGEGGRRVASGVQVVTRGPLLPTVTDVWSAGDGQQAGGRVSDRPDDRGAVLRSGVQSETVAGIGVAAFLLGVTLMGGVWLIHSKIGPSKRHHFQAVPQNPTLEVAGQSTNSTPSSHAPIII